MAPVRRLQDDEDTSRDPGLELELLEFPAAVVCATCGAGDCPGCHDERVTGHSGVVVFVPWERAGGVFARFWATTRASTDGADAFFFGLPDGPVGAALSYALVAEVAAVGSSLAVCFAAGAALVWALFPAWAALLASETATRLACARVFVVMVTSFTWLLVSVHALHGWLLDRAASRAGAARATTRALRFGLYASGWDVMTSPLGALVTLVTAGPRAALGLTEHAIRTPGRATSAMLRGLYRLDGDAAARARGHAMRVTMVASVALVVVALGVSALALRA
ncbi:MAG: hypothetical protein IT374_26865 [Polyangiaceae bacterium]|nr:hypothetical protein [Polyangiaceae bacterium]